MARTLDSDQLGKKGEKRFAELCVDGGLIPNEASWDRKGWDFVVDWRHETTRADYDSRPTLPSCLVQVKTQWEGATAVNVPLLALEHIAKDLKPAFLFVLQAADDRSYTNGFIAHLDGALLGLVLKSLRQARVAKKRPSKQEIRLPLKRWFKPVQVDGPALRTALEQAVGPSMGAYAEAKQQQLQNLGFESGRMDLTVQLATGDRQEIADVFLGLRPIAVTRATAIETRFGIPIPIPDFLPMGGELHISPRSSGRATLVIRDGVRRPFKFQGEMFALPNQLLDPGELQTLIKTKLFDLRFRATGVFPPMQVKITLTLSMDGERIRKARVRASEWLSLYGFLAAAADHPVQIEILTAKGPAPIFGTVDLNERDEDWDDAAHICELADRVFEHAGWPGTKLAIEDIGAAWEKLEVVDAFLTNPSALNALSFTSSTFDGAVDGAKHKCLYVDYIPFGEHSIAYSVEAQMLASVQGDEVHWKSVAMSILQVRRISSRERDYDRFAEDSKRQMGHVELKAVRTFASD